MSQISLHTRSRVDSFYVPSRFVEAVSLHIVKNIAHLDIDVPLILGIHGRPGEGKTRQCEIVMKRMGVDYVVVSGGELEHHLAGRVGELIRDRYLEASKRVDNRRGAVLLINDFDTGVGVWSRKKGHERTIYQYTVNLQNVYATLMNLADHPMNVDGQKCNRIPIIITGNDFAVLHEPLIRDGRMTKLRWQTTSDEKIEICRFLEDLLRHEERALLPDFVLRHVHQPISFFSHLKSVIVNKYVLREIHRIGVENVVSDVISRDLRFQSGLCGIEELEEAASAIESELVVTRTENTQAVS